LISTNHWLQGSSGGFELDASLSQQSVAELDKTTQSRQKSNLGVVVPMQQASSASSDDRSTTIMASQTASLCKTAVISGDVQPPPIDYLNTANSLQSSSSDKPGTSGCFILFFVVLMFLHICAGRHWM